MTGIVEWLRSMRYLGARARKIVVLLGLQLLAAVFEGIGVGMLLPVAQFISQKGDLGALVQAGPWWRYLIEFFAMAGIPVSLGALLGFSFAAILGRQVFAFAAAAYRIRSREGDIHAVRARAFAGFLAARTNYQEEAPIGEIVNEIVVEAGRAVRALYNTIMVTGSLLLFVVYFSGLMWVSPEMTLASLGILGVSALAMVPLVRKTGDVGERITKYNQHLARFLVERLKLAHLIRLSGTDLAETQNLSRISRRQANTTAAAQLLGERITLTLAPLAMALGFVLLYLGVEFFGLSIEVMAIFLLAIMRLLPVTRTLMSDAQAIAANLASLRLVTTRLREIEAACEAKSGRREFAALAHGIRFEGVEFAYGAGEPGLAEKVMALHGVDLEIPAGRLTALVGPSGAGKSTLIDLLPRLRLPTAGRILLDGTPLDEFALESLRAGIAFVPQRPDLFDVSVAEHIRYGRPEAGDDEIREAARLAIADEFIERLPQGYETPLGQAGHRLSGGQQQRLDLARALLRRSPILILDEPASDLDAESAGQLKQSLARIRERGDITLIVIAHSFASIDHADQIVVMRDGRVSERGTHDQLAGNDGWYARALARQSGDVGDLAAAGAGT
ncbi:MAG: ABC transporter ATP-binding protein [Alphaproteobacteria bacterium]